MEAETRRLEHLVWMKAAGCRPSDCPNPKAVANAGQFRPAAGSVKGPAVRVASEDGAFGRGMLTSLLNVQSAAK